MARKRRVSTKTKIKRKVKRSKKKIIAYTCVALTGFSSPAAYFHSELAHWLIDSAAHSAPENSLPFTADNNYQIPTDKALELLDHLTVHAKVTGAKYERVAEFGKPWTDDNDDLFGHNGCDTRNDILARDMTNITYKTTRSHHESCAVESGTINEPYLGHTVEFHRGGKHGQSDAIQIDHIVPLKNSWQTGAYKISQQQRINLANDPLNLLAVDGKENNEKRDNDASGWLPKNKRFRCTYVTRQIEVKTKYDLWVTPSEKTAITRVLHQCSTQ